MLQKIGNVVISRRKPMKYEVLVSEHYATSVVVEARRQKIRCRMGSRMGKHKRCHRILF